MNGLNRVLIGSILLFAASCTNEFPSRSQVNLKNAEIMEKNEKQLIVDLLEDYKKALNTSDAKFAQSLYTSNGMFMPTEAPSGIGSDGILQAYEHVFSQIQLHVDFFIEEIQVEGTMAFAVTNSKGTTLIHATGETVPESNRELFVFEKINGTWKIARYMFNKTEAKG